MTSYNTPDKYSVMELFQTVMIMLPGYLDIRNW